MSTKPKAAKRQHYFLAAGQIVFKVDGNDEANILSMNGMITQANTTITRDSIGRIQHTLQANFHERMKGIKFEIIDCVINNIMHLGHMFQEEFFAVPDGVELKQKPVATAVAAEVPATMAAMQQDAANG